MSAVRVEELMVAMPDGVRLNTKVARTDDEPRPVVLIRGYRTDFWGGIAERFVDAGYVYVGQATRGHIGSEGAQGMDNRFFDDGQDGYDAITWIAEQNWCNGRDVWKLLLRRNAVARGAAAAPEPEGDRSAEH